MRRFACGVLFGAIALLGVTASAQTFKNPSILATAEDPQSLASGDFNQDGKQDILYVDDYIDTNGMQVITLHVLLGNGDGSFTHKQDIVAPSGICACFLNVADVTKDGIPDVILGSAGATAEVAVIPGNGDGTFGSPVVSQFTVQGGGANPALGGRMAIGDFNGDGFADLVVTDPANNYFHVLLGDGTGKFQLGNSYFDNYGSPAYAYDLDGDGHLDVLIFDAPGGEFLVNLGKGDGTFAAGVRYAIGPSGATNIVFKDLNGDGHPDVVAVLYPGMIEAFLGKSDGTFGAAQKIGTTPDSYASVVDFEDFNQDKQLDMVLFDSVGVGVGLGKGSLAYAAPVSSVSGPGSINTFATADFNGDGQRDIVMGVEGGIALLKGKGDGTFVSADTYAIGQSVGATAVADFNGDGHPDIAVTTPEQFPSLLLGAGDGTFKLGVNQNMSSNSSNTPSETLVAGDFNGDAQIDLITTYILGPDNPVSPPNILLGNGNGTFQTPIAEPNGSTIIADLNNDHRSDMILINTNTIDVELGQKDGTFSLVSTALRNPQFSKLTAIGDLNGDKIPDLVLADEGGYEIWFGNGDGSFRYIAGFNDTVIGGIAEGDYPSSGLVDLDGDGKLDLILGPESGSALGQSGTLYILYGNGDGTFQTPVSMVISHPYPFLSFADVNGDGKPDILLNDGKGISIIHNLGGRSFDQETHYVAGAAFESISVADLNGDGYPDIVAADSFGKQVAVLLNEPNVAPPGGYEATLAVAIAPEPSAYDQPFTITASVTSTGAETVAPTGSVTFSIDGSVAGEVVLASGSAALQIKSALSSGSHVVTTVYSGDENYRFESSSMQHVVEARVYATTTTMTAAPASLLTSQTLRLHTQTKATGTTPFGSIIFFDGAVEIGNQAMDDHGEVYFDTSLLAAGVHSITASFPGNSEEADIGTILAPSSSAPVMVTVTADATTIQLTSSSDTPTAGTVVTLTAVVSSKAGTPFGGVTFSDGGIALGTAAVDGSGHATFSTASLTAGSHSITARYYANGTFASSTSAATSVAVNTAAPLLAGSATALTVVQAQSGGKLVLTAHVAANRGALLNGMVTFLKNGSVVGSSVLANSAEGADGEANLLIAAGEPGATPTYAWTASYGGNSAIAPSASPMVQDRWPSGAPSYSMSLDSPSIALGTNGSATVGLEFLVPANLKSPISLSCSAPIPAGLGCSFSTATVSASGRVFLTVDSARQGSSSSTSSQVWGLAGGGVLALGFALFGGGFRRRLTTWSILVVGLVLLALTGCGSTKPTTALHVTSSVVTITAVSGSGESQVQSSDEVLVKSWSK